MSHSLSVILPCYNEAQAIPLVLKKLITSRKQIIKQCQLTDLEIIVVNDGSTDDSIEQLLSFEGEIQIVEHPQCQGYGRALKTGIQHAHGSLIAFYDLDDTCQPLDLIPMIKAAIVDKVDLVSGSRLSSDTEMPIVRWIGNWLYIKLTQLLLRHPIQDCCSGYRLFRAHLKEPFMTTLPDDLNFTLAMTIAFIRGEGSFREIPIRYKERVGQSKLKPLIHGPLFLLTLLKYCLSPSYSKRVLQSQFASS